MKNVSFETAKALRDAGFPQPEPAEGQFWYNPDYGLFVVGRRSFIDGTMRNIFYFETGKTYEKSVDSFSLCVFAPQAHDILFALMDYEKLSLATEGISEFLEIIILPEELAKKWMEFNSKPA